MTEEETLKLMGDCLDRGRWPFRNVCNHCPFYSFGKNCTEELKWAVTDIVNRKNTEINRLKGLV